MYALGEPVFKLQRFLSKYHEKWVHVYDLHPAFVEISRHPNAHGVLALLENATRTHKYDYLHNCTADERIAIDTMSTLELRHKLLAEPDNKKAYVLASMRHDVVAVFDQNPHLAQQYLPSDRLVTAQLSKNVHAMPILENYINQVSLEKFDFEDLFRNLLSNQAIVQLSEHYWKGMIQHVLSNPSIYATNTTYYRLACSCLNNPNDQVVQYILDNWSEMLRNSANCKWGIRNNPNNRMMDWLEEHKQHQRKHKNYLHSDEGTILRYNPSLRAVQKVKEEIDGCYERVAAISSQTPAEEVDHIVHQFQLIVLSWRLWNALLANPAAFELFEQHVHKYKSAYHYHDYSTSSDTYSSHNDGLSWFDDRRKYATLFENPAAFDYDYAAMRDNMRPFAEEIIAKAMHPRRMAQWIEEEDIENMEEVNMKEE